MNQTIQIALDWQDQDYYLGQKAPLELVLDRLQLAGDGLRFVGAVRLRPLQASPRSPLWAEAPAAPDWGSSPLNLRALRGQKTIYPYHTWRRWWQIWQG